MEIVLQRSTTFKYSIIGALYINKEFLCFTLEDLEREIKIAGKTCIPKGRYRVVLSWSNRFKKFLPELLDVPNFRGIRIHTGNTHHDTEGCILVGMNYDVGLITRSRDAMGYLMQKINKVHKKEKIFITIK